MFRIFKIISIIIYLTYSSSCLFAQCTPSNLCFDALNNGELCPDKLSDGTIHIPYNESVTIVPPTNANFGSQGIIPLKKIKIIAIDNLPAGLTWLTNASNAEFNVTNPSTKYCIILSGTPSISGTFLLKIKALYYTDYSNGYIQAPEQIEDLTVSITINSNLNSNLNASTNKFSYFDPEPNPFTTTTRIGFYAARAGWYELIVFDVVGNKLHNEKKVTQKGECYFDFTGIKLSRGVYFYSIQNGQDKITRQLIKQ